MENIKTLPERWIGRPEGAYRKGKRIYYTIKGTGEFSDFETYDEPFRKMLVTVTLVNGEDLLFGIYLNRSRKDRYEEYTSLLKSDNPRLENVLIVSNNQYSDRLCLDPTWYVMDLFKNGFYYSNSNNETILIIESSILKISVKEI